MGEARDVMDRVSEAVFHGYEEYQARLYASDAVAVTPDQGEVKGAKGIVEWSKEFLAAFPNAHFELVYAHECGNTAIDEGYLVGTNTGPLRGPTGESIAPTGKSVRVRYCDVATVENGVITSHRFYLDQMEVMDQLGLMEGPS